MITLRELKISWELKEIQNSHLHSNPTRGPKDIMPYLSHWADDIRENLIAVFFDVKMRIIGHRVVSIGTESSCTLSMKDLFTAALLANASAMILCHNHPSGELKPSLEDILGTQKAIQASKYMDIPIIDHLIIGLGKNGVDYYSFQENGMMEAK